VRRQRGGGRNDHRGGRADERSREPGRLGESELDLELDDFYFEPTVLTGAAGETLMLHLENEGSTEHNFSVSDQGIDQDVEDGGNADVTVTFPESGTLMFFCKYHQDMGMRGALEVA
jgi:plastocyanin